MTTTTARLRSAAGRAKRAARTRWQSITAGPLPSDHQPVFILGHQKAGTSAIAALLGEYTGLSATIDLKQEIRDLLIPRIVSGQADLEDLIKRNREEFAAPIVKHPNLTLIYPSLRLRFPESQFVFVVRDPRDNIRSILDRLDLPGDLETIDDEHWAALPRPWRLILGEGQPGWERRTYLEALADRWAGMVRTYLEHRNQMHLIRYEDFREAKETEIANLARSLRLPAAADISKSVDQPFQQRGMNRNIPVGEFFGPHNLRRIEDRCQSEMHQIGYEPQGDAGA